MQLQSVFCVCIKRSHHIVRVGIPRPSLLQTATIIIYNYRLYNIILRLLLLLLLLCTVLQPRLLHARHVCCLLFRGKHNHSWLLQRQVLHAHLQARTPSRCMPVHGLLQLPHTWLHERVSGYHSILPRLPTAHISGSRWRVMYAYCRRPFCMCTKAQKYVELNVLYTAAS